MRVLKTIATLIGVLIIFLIGHSQGSAYMEKQDAAKSVLSRAKALIDLNALDILHRQSRVSDSALHLYKTCYTLGEFCTDSVEREARTFLEPYTSKAKKKLEKSYGVYKEDKRSLIRYIYLSFVCLF
jgi:hypothetical protein